DPRFWRPPLYQLSHSPKCKNECPPFWLRGSRDPGIVLRWPSWRSFSSHILVVLMIQTVLHV
ncbi:MAG TPA: hypothetical protein PKI03_30395, partial [Pseudomonadota bacterium]|nr:hypothetical protein [Pseudomonadota bacterium]